MQLFNLIYHLNQLFIVGFSFSNCWMLNNIKSFVEAGLVTEVKD